MVTGTLLAATVAVVVSRDGPRPLARGQAASAPGTPAHPSGRFLPTWLPGNLRVQTEQEWAAGTEARGSGWTRTYIRRGPLGAGHDVVTISLEEGAPALDIDAEVARYAGARHATVQARPAMSLGLVAARHDAALVWSPGPGRLAQVLGSGVSEEELSAVADGFQLPPRLDATPVPHGFTELQRSDEHPYPAAVPRAYAVNTLPMRGPSRPPGTPSVQIIASWAGVVPPGNDTVTVRERTGVVTTDGDQTVLAWSERPDLVVRVAGTNLALDEVHRIASELREQSVEEVEARPAGVPALLARGNIGGRPYELRTTSGASGPCLELAHGWVGSACSVDPLREAVEFEPSTLQGVVFGSVLRDAASVRLELDGGQAVETDPVGKAAGLATAFYVTALPPNTRVLAVVALGPQGQVLRRTPVR